MDDGRKDFLYNCVRAKTGLRQSFVNNRAGYGPDEILKILGRDIVFHFVQENDFVFVCACLQGFPS